MKKYTLFLRNTSDSFVNFTTHEGKSVTLGSREHLLIVVEAKYKGFYNSLIKNGVSISVIKEEESEEVKKVVSKVEETEEVKKETERKTLDYYKSKNKPELMSILDGLGIKYKASFTKDKLIKLIEENHD